MSSSTEMAASKLLQDISDAITEQARDSTFCCGGTVPVESQPEDSVLDSSKPITIRFDENRKTHKVTLPPDAGDSAELADLVHVCEPASFGRGGEDVIDETYRKAGKLDTNSFATTFCPYTTGIMDVVTQLLLPSVSGNKPHGVVAQLYKLNVYSAPSGKFKAHVDTPRSKSQIGSLVVSLPVAHQGGELVVRQTGKQVVYDWSSKERDDEPAINWAAFYSDCEHEVLEVTSGHRVTLTYNLFTFTPAPGHVAGKVDGLLDPTKLPLYQILDLALQCPSFFRRGRIIGIYLTHAYAHTSNKAHQLENHGMPSCLKGADMAIYEVVRALGLRCQLRPIITAESDAYPYGHKHNVSINLMGDRFQTLRFAEELEEGQDCIGFVEDAVPSERLSNHVTTWLNTAPETAEEAALAYVTYGNQAMLEMEYSAAAILFRVPPYKKRGAPVDGKGSIFDDVKPDSNKYDGEPEGEYDSESSDEEEDAEMTEAEEE